MPTKKPYLIRFKQTLVSDFETTVYEGQTKTEVWASAFVPLYSENVVIDNCIEDYISHIFSIKSNCLIYFHNLRFDGAFILSYLLRKAKYKQAYSVISEVPLKIEWYDDQDMPNNSIKYMISFMGQWYRVLVKHDGYYYEFRDSLKLLPFAVEKIGKDFNTKHKKLSIEYKGYRQPHGIITDEEKAYIANDVLVVKEALEIMMNDGHKRMTIGSCCMQEFRKVSNEMIVFYNGVEMKAEFSPFDAINPRIDFISMPYLYDFELDKDKYGAENAGVYCRKSYRGGWCYLARGKENKIYNNGTTADVNSLYPSVMHSESGNFYPYGEPHFYKFHSDYSGEKQAKILIQKCEAHLEYDIIRIRTRFMLKFNKLPTIMVKHNPLYDSREMLETSNIRDRKTGEYCDYYIDIDGNKAPAKVELTLTWNDLKLVYEHYSLYDTEYLDYVSFACGKGMFDQYINKYRKIKETSKGAQRTLAKLFLNNLYGKLGMSTNSSFKVISINNDGSLGFNNILEQNKRAGYVAMGTAVTSYAREFTIRAAQKNYHGKSKRGFIYADTDSIHCDLAPDEIEGIKVDDNAFCCWKLESQWDKSIFVRAKTYIEHITHENRVECEPFYDIKCAGMPKNSKELLIDSFEQRKRADYHYSEEEYEFISQKRDLSDFKSGLQVSGKLLPKQIEGGVLLVDTKFTVK